MQVNRVNNQQPTFGIKYVKPRKWDPEVLKTFMDSKLVQEIDAKYPKAQAIFEEHFFGLYDSLNSVSLTIKLAKNKVMDLFYRSEEEKNYDCSITDCQKKIETTTLADIEKYLEEEQIEAQLEQMENDKNEQIFNRAEAENTKARTPFQKFICQIFGIK